MYNDIDFNKLFDNESEYGKKYNKGKLNDATIIETEKLLGRKLPKSYIEFLKIQNGGYINDNFEDSWLTAIDGLESNQSNIYLEDSYDPFAKDELISLGLAKSLVPFGETQSDGHDVSRMASCSWDKNGEPRIVNVELEGEVELHFIANNFEEFIYMIYNSVDIDGTYIDIPKVKVDEAEKNNNTNINNKDDLKINAIIVLCIAIIFLIFLIPLGKIAIIIDCSVILICIALIVYSIYKDKKRKS